MTILINKGFEMFSLIQLRKITPIEGRREKIPLCDMTISNYFYLFLVS